MGKKIKKCLLIKAISILAFAFILGVVPACNGASSQTTQPTEEKTGPKFVAHKGYSSKHLGNTEESFRAAAELGFYGIETDIRKTKDDRFVCNHDADVYFADDPTQGVTISTTNLADLISRPLKNDKDGKEAYLCTFENYLKACKAGNKVAVIELKDYFNKKSIQKILEIIDAEYDRKQVTFISFIYDNLEKVREEDPTIPLQYLSQTNDDSNFERCLQDGISVDVRMDVKKPILTEEFVKTFHDAGLTVNVWTVNDDASLEIATSYGVDYITTDVYYEE